MSGPMGGNPGALPRAGKGNSQRKMPLKGLRMGSYVLICYREKKGQGHVDEKVDYEGTIIDKRVGWDNRESYVELKDCVKLNNDGEIIAREGKKRLIDAFIDDCEVIEKEDRPISAQLVAAESRGKKGGTTRLNTSPEAHTDATDGEAFLTPGDEGSTAVAGTAPQGMQMQMGMVQMVPAGMMGMMPGMQPMAMGMAPGMQPMAMGMAHGMQPMAMGGMPMGMAPGMPMMMGAPGMPMGMAMQPMAMGGAMPMGMMPQGMMPQGMMPQGMMPQGMMPQGGMMAMPMGMGMVPQGMMAVPTSGGDVMCQAPSGMSSPGSVTPGAPGTDGGTGLTHTVTAGLAVAAPGMPMVTPAVPGTPVNVGTPMMAPVPMQAMQGMMPGMPNTMLAIPPAPSGSPRPTAENRPSRSRSRGR